MQGKCTIFIIRDETSQTFIISIKFRVSVESSFGVCGRFYGGLADAEAISAFSQLYGLHLITTDTLCLPFICIVEHSGALVAQLVVTWLSFDNQLEHGDFSRSNDGLMIAIQIHPILLP